MQSQTGPGAAHDVEDPAVRFDQRGDDLSQGARDGLGEIGQRPDQASMDAVPEISRTCDGATFTPRTLPR